MLDIRGNKDLWITRGDDAYLDLELRQPTFPYDIYEFKSSDVVVLSVRKSRDADVDDNNPILLQIPLENGRFHIRPEDTEFMDFGNYSYDVQITFSDGKINTVIGPNVFRILPEVTY